MMAGSAVPPERPAVSVLMPVYNTARFLACALDSIRHQTFADFELVVIDDGSTDGSADIAREAMRSEPRMRFLARENRGLIASRNQLLSQARGEFVAWMDSDDEAAPERLARQLQTLRQHPELVCVGSSVECIDVAGAAIGEEVFPADHAAILEQQLRGGGMRFPSTMMRTGVVLDVGGFREPFRIGEDLDLFLRLGERGRLTNLDAKLLRYRLHPSSVSFELRPHWTAYRDVILGLAEERRMHGTDRLQRGERVTVDVSASPAARESVGVLHERWARQALAWGNRKAALRHAWLAVSARPLSLGSWRVAASVALRALPRG